MNSLKKAGYAIFFVGSIVLLAIPFITFLFNPSTETIENKTLQEIPEFIEADSSINVDYLSELGSYFAERFPLRSLLISMDANFNETLFGESGIDNVICGSDGWLYYRRTLDDYMGMNQLDEVGIASCVYDFSYLKDYVEQQTGGAQVLFTIPPNKNTVYPSFMPWRYLREDGLHVAQKLQPLLETRGINYVDLVTLYSDVPQVATDEEPFLYYKRDTHWSCYGALPAYEAVMKALGKPYHVYGLSDVQWGDRRCDLEDMLHPGEYITSFVPVSLRTDSEFVRTITTETGATIEEFKSPAEGSLVLFGDSFRSNIGVPLSANYGRSMLCQFGFRFELDELLSQETDVVIFERVERSLTDMLEGIVFPAEEIESPSGLSAIEAEDLSLGIEAQNSYYHLYGSIGDLMDDPLDIMDGCVGLELEFADGSTKAFKALRGIDDEPGSFYADIPQDIWAGGVQSVCAFATDAQGNIICASSYSL